MLKWVKADDEINQHIMSTYGTETDCDGTDLYNSIVTVFMDCDAKQLLDPEEVVQNIDLKQICNPLDETQVCVKLNKYFVARKNLNESI